MTSRPWLAAALVAALLLAGCAADDGPGSVGPETPAGGGGNSEPGGAGQTPGGPGNTPASPPPATSVLLLNDFALLDCTGIAIAQLTDAAAVQALLPDGFTVRTEVDPVTGQDTGRASLVVDAFACGNFTIPTAAVPDTWFGHVYTFVEPPVDIAPEAAAREGDHEYLFRVLAGPDVLADVWMAAGYDAYRGEDVAMNLSREPAPGVVLSEVTVAEGAIGDYVLGGVVAAAAEAAEARPFSRYSITDAGGLLLWTGMEQLPRRHVGAGEGALAADDPLMGLGFPIGNELAGPALTFEGASYTGQVLTLHTELPVGGP